VTCTCAPPEGGSVRLEDFFPNVIPFVMGIPDEVAAHAIREAAILLARRAQVLRRHITIETLPDVPDYQLELEDDYVVIGLLDVALFGSRLSALNRPPLDRHTPTRPSYYFAPPDDLRVYPSPSRESPCGLEVVAAVSPGRDSCFLDRVLYDHHAAAIGAGAVASIMQMRGGDWYDPVGAERHWRSFALGAADAKAAASRSYSSGPTYMTTRRWV
jgi:hypothetical protein